MKRVYTFGDGKAEGNASMRNLLGGKGANLAEMNLLGMPVPPGFTITTEVCTEYTQYGRDEVVKRLQKDVEAAIAHVEQLTGKKFNDPTNPLLVSVRSGARASMPGMMDTVLNLGMNDATVATGRKERQSPLRMGQLPSFRTDVWRRCSRHEAQEQNRHRSLRGYHGQGERGKGVKLDTELDVDDLKNLLSSSRLPLRITPAKTSPTALGNSSGVVSALCLTAG